MRVGITGASGLIGSELTTQLRSREHEVIAFVRRAAGAGEIPWDPATGQLDPSDLAGIDAVVHLAGAGIGDQRWTHAYKQTLLDSRVDGTALLARSIAGLEGKGPTILLSGSAVGFYGNRGDEEIDERSVAGDGFLADICRRWEAATAPAAETVVRVAHLRTGIVLSREGGALPKMLPPFRFGVGGRFGNGRQWMSWISIDDTVRAIAHLLTSEITGPVNLVAPTPVRNNEFARQLGAAVHRPAVVAVPRFTPRLLLGAERADALLFDGQRVAPQVLTGDGFTFSHPTLEVALEAVLGN